MRPHVLVFMPLVALASCGGGTASPAVARAPAAEPASRVPPAAPSPSSKPAEPAAETSDRSIPTACAAKGEACLPPRGFVKELCGGFYPDIALILFAKDSPWTRGYLTRDVQAWNASGGASSTDKLVFDEEVLVLFHREADQGGVVVSGAGGGYEVLRWDGSCASLAGEELTLKRPPKAKSARVVWKSLSLAVRDALAADERVGAKLAAQRKECKGVTFGSVSDKCVRADAALGAGVVEYVRNGGVVPRPAALP